MEYTVSQLALEFERSEQYIRKVAKEQGIGSQVKGVWKFTETDRVSFKSIFNPDTRSFTEQMDELSAEFEDVTAPSNAIEIYAGAMVPIDETEDWNFESVIEKVRKYNSTLEEQLELIRQDQLETDLEHEERMQMLEAELQKAKEQSQALQIEKKKLVHKITVAKSREREELEKIVRLKQLGVKLAGS